MDYFLCLTKIQSLFNYFVISCITCEKHFTAASDRERELVGTFALSGTGMRYGTPPTSSNRGDPHRPEHTPEDGVREGGEGGREGGEVREGVREGGR